MGQCSKIATNFMPSFSNHKLDSISNNTSLPRCESTSFTSSTNNLVHHDKTNYFQSFIHIIKGNLGTGIMALPSTFALSKLTCGSIGLPLICLISLICVHFLLRCAQLMEKRTNINQELGYAELAKIVFESGPKRVKKHANSMCKTIKGMVIFSQFGFCCAYILFVVDNTIEVSQY